MSKKTRRHDGTGRSSTEPRHVRLYEWLMATPAWQSLSAEQRAAYVELKRLYNGSNNGEIAMSVRRLGELLHVGKSSAARALAVLEERGFIRARQKGGFSCKVRHSSEWVLTEHGTADENPSKEFARWTPEKQNTVPPQGQSVPVLGPTGPSAGTMVSKKAAYGPSGGTVKAAI
ncbi:hypothetical protein [Prosthecomicrobium pneumaticum]|uniref:DNA-binding transcriptional MocR family regulator n=1 Tax=Prosthecomicrobium pneumaticum TaxID=81895 RepID=A0A7W9L397_9HYPH|nr:hypothetical protein [Prosthecomicrobium pneumaticum]MBB5754343.1 DNA-binding transcriptional MocR family regulator [Prosthecomicrobium pneumaticum]